MWTMDCGDDHGNEVKVGVSPPIFCQPSTKMNKPSIFSHLIPAEKKLVVQSTRWSPTAEQLMALEELYRHGTRTPTALQIQEITAKLRRFGKIEGKNVFYWFQNHKARDKKKQRLKSTLLQSSIIPPKVTTLQVEQTKREPYSNCSTISEEYSSVVPAETPTTHRRIAQVDHEFQPIIKTEEENQYVSSLKSMKMPFCFPIINLSGTKPNTLISLALDHNKLMERAQDSSMPIEKPGLSFFTSIFGSEIRDNTIIQTLELFPLQSENLKGYDQITTSDDITSDQDLENEAANSGGDHKIDLSLTLVHTSSFGELINA